MRVGNVSGCTLEPLVFFCSFTIFSEFQCRLYGLGRRQELALINWIETLSSFFSVECKELYVVVCMLWHSQKIRLTCHAYRAARKTFIFHFKSEHSLRFYHSHLGTSFYAYAVAATLGGIKWSFFNLSTRVQEKQRSDDWLISIATRSELPRRLIGFTYTRQTHFSSRSLARMCSSEPYCCMHAFGGRANFIT